MRNSESPAASAARPLFCRIVTVLGLWLPGPARNNAPTAGPVGASVGWAVRTRGTCQNPQIACGPEPPPPGEVARNPGCSTAARRIRHARAALDLLRLPGPFLPAYRT